MKPSTLALKTATREQLIADMVALGNSHEIEYADESLEEVRGMWIASIICDGDLAQARAVIASVNRKGIPCSCHYC